MRKNNIRTLVTFKSDIFNTSVEKESFINPKNYGDDMASWIVSEFKMRNIETDSEIGQEDHGWYVNFTLQAQSYNFIIGFLPDDETNSNWIGWVEKQTGFFASLLGQHKKNITVEAVNLIHHILANSSQFTNILWHKQDIFDKGIIEGSNEPMKL